MSNDIKKRELSFVGVISLSNECFQQSASTDEERQNLYKDATSVLNALDQQERPELHITAARMVADMHQDLNSTPETRSLLPPSHRLHYKSTKVCVSAFAPGWVTAPSRAEPTVWVYFQIAPD